MRLKSVVKIKKKLKVEIQTLCQNEAVLKALSLLLITDFFMLQRVNPLVPRKLQNLEPTDLPVGALNIESFVTFDSEVRSKPA
jgi:hypothetical protein